MFLPQTLKQIVIAGIVCVMFASALKAEGQPLASQQELGTMIEKSFPYILQEGKAWQEDQGCLSCHVVSFTYWSLNKADRLGWEVGSQDLKELRSWAEQWQNMVAPERREEAVEETTLAGANDTISQLLLGQTAAENASWQTTYRNALIDSQDEAGFWPAGGQLPMQKRPKEETKAVSTMWAMITLYQQPQERRITKAIEQADNWLKNQPAGESTEWWTTKLILAVMQQDEAEAAQFQQKLLSSQHEDGGWGWLTADNSDAFGTGMAIYALAYAGMTAEDPQIVQSLNFLQRTQNADGSWPVHGTKQNRKAEISDTATYWGTCWAVIGALEYIRPVAKNKITQLSN